MPKTCAAYKCTNRASKGSSISFYKFPLKDDFRLRQWLVAMRRENFIPTHHHYICSNHFKEECFLKGYKLVRKLSEDAVPTEFDFSDHLEKVPDTSSHAFSCSVCAKTFRSKDTLFRHEISHSGSKPFQCDVCQEGFSSSVALKEHKARHDNTMLYNCTECPKSFRQNSSFRRHLLIHSKNLAHVCSICNRKFSRIEYLKSHMTVHTKEHPHSCNQCSKSFAHLSDLNRHKILHSGLRPYECLICGSSFADHSSHKRHVKNHDNVVNLTCCYCQVSFKKAKQLKTHMTAKHHDVKETFSKNNLETNSKIVSDIQEQSDLVTGELKCRTSQENPCPVENNNALTDQLNCPIITMNENSETATSHFQKNGEIGTLQQDTLIIHTVSSNHISKEILHISQLDYITCPDFQSQEYYNWLSDFTSLCKLLSYPIEPDLFMKISQVHKTVVDVLANPSGILSNRANFTVLRSISNELLDITNEHLKFICDRLQP